MFTKVSLTTRLTGLVVLTLVPVVVLLVLSNVNERDSKREDGIREATTYARSTATALNGFARNVEGFMAAAAVVLGARDEGIEQATTRLYLSALSTRYENGEALFVFGLDGRIVAWDSPGAMESLDVTAEPYFAALQAGVEAIWTIGFTGRTDSEVTGIYARVIRTPEGEAQGYLVLAFKPSVGDGLSELPDDANVLLISQDGTTVFSLSDPQLDERASFVGDDRYVAQALDGLFVQLKDVSTPFDGDRRYGAFAPIPAMGWVIGYTRSQSVLNSEFYGGLLRDIGVMVGVLVASIVAANLVARQIIRPVRRLARAASQMEGGHRIPGGEVSGDPDLHKLQEAFASMSVAVSEREDHLTNESSILLTLEDIGASLAAELDFNRAVQAITDAGRLVTQAATGAFFYRVDGHEESSFQLYAWSGRDPDTLTDFPLPEEGSAFSKAIAGEGPVRIDDLSLLTHAAPADEASTSQSSGWPRVRSYIAVPVFGSEGRVLGCLAFGHRSPQYFSERHERLLVGLSSWAAVVLDNARLYSEARAMQDELLDANRAKDEFLGLISHELRSPTTTIYGGARVLASHYATLDAQDRSELIGSIEEEARRLVRLIDNLLAMARLDLGREIERRPVAIDELTAGAVDSFRVMHKDRRLDFKFEADLPMVAAEGGYISQILENLLSNALKYSPEGSSLEIDICRGEGVICVSVSDHGKGVLASETEAIFESFYRSDRTSQSAPGHGLGLTVCKRLLERQGGAIWAENRSSGGLRVTFSLPIWGGDTSDSTSPTHVMPESAAP